MIKIYTDGSCKPTNPGPAGYGVVIIENNVLIHFCSAFIGNQTNNVAEIKGIEYALDYLEYVGKSWEETVIYTDSGYCVGLFTKNWKASKNQDLVAKVKKTLEQFPNLDIKWVKGHNGDHYNEMVDKLAGIAVEHQITKNGVTVDDIFNT